MSEHWKSTPKYWCKHCSVFVRDTKLERQNHEATGRHQGSLKRFLRDLHRGHEREEREKERVRREIERLNGVVGTGSGSGSGSGASGSSSGAPGAPSSAQTTASQLTKQREQLAGLGVSLPNEFRAEMAMAGEWTVTTTRVMDDDGGGGAKKDNSTEGKIEAKATGVRKREVTEDEKEEQEAVKGLFKKRKRWGGTRAMPQEDSELDALLSADVLRARPAKKEEEPQEDEIKKEEEEEGGQENIPSHVKSEETEEKEPLDDGDELLDRLDKVPPPPPTVPETAVKREDGADTGPAPVIFKKRKPKNIRQK